MSKFINRCIAVFTLPLLVAVIFSSCSGNSANKPRVETDPMFSRARQPLADGIHFSGADSVYTAKAGEPFEIEYSLCFVNVPGFKDDEIDKVQRDTFVCPQGITKIADSCSYAAVLMTGYEVYNRYCNVKLNAPKTGNYTIPELTFAYAGKKYTAPPVKVIVK
jgi:hypothetical protein